MVNDPCVNLSSPLLNEMEIISTSYESFMYQCTQVEKEISLLLTQSLGVHIFQSIYDQFLIISSLLLRIGSNVKIALANNANSMEKIKLISFNIANKFFEISEKYIKNTYEYLVQDKHPHQIDSTIELIHTIRSSTKGISCLVSKEILKSSYHSRGYSISSSNLNIEERNDEEKQTLSYFDNSNSCDISNYFTGFCIALFLIFIIVVSYLKINE